MIMNIELQRDMNIIDLLPSKCDDQNILWKLGDSDRDCNLYEKYTQYTECKLKPVTIKKEIKTVLQFSQIKENPKPCKIVEQKTETVVKNEVQKPKHTSKKRESPMDLMVKLTENTDINSGYMREKLIEFITKKEFHKFFGVKKSSEVMSGISGNKWNKSLVVFMSFMFDVSFIYLNKDVKFESEKKYNTVITI